MFQRVNYGPVTNEKNQALRDLTPREWVVLVPIVALVVLMGVLPNLFLRPIGPSVERMLSQMRANPPVRVQASAQRPTPSAQPPASNAQREAPGAQLR
jgi:NADH-quinone oxidoreductase subunit M